jgi:hypothetical protein
MAERDRWCRGVMTGTWHFVRAGAVTCACGRAFNWHLWPSAPGADERYCRSCVRIAGAAGLAATQPPAPAEPTDPAYPTADYGPVVAF